MTIISIPSPNYSPRTMRPTHVVMHIAEGTLAGCDAWFAREDNWVSAHYCVGKRGEIHQYVHETDAAWANGAVAQPSIPLPSSANPNEWTISIEHEGYTGEAWTPEMYQADAWLLRGMAERWGIPLDRDHIIGHCDLDSVTRPNCPGTGLDFDRLLREAKGVRMNATLAKLLAERKPSRRGVHGTGNAHDSEQYYANQFDEWAACGMSWLKLVVAGDSQRNTVTLLNRTGNLIIPVIRFYNTACPSNTIDPGALKPYMDEGVKIFESPFNEFYAPFENTWPGGQMPADWPQQVARGWAQFARIVLDAGGVPTTPSIETWQYDRIFIPLFSVLCADYADLLRESIVAMHNRTLNHPVGYSADPGGFLGWTWFDDFIAKRVGPVPLLATEAGPEPGWDQDSNFQRVTPTLHASMIRDILSWPTPSHYLGDCFWLWEGDGAWDGARWKNNRQHMNGADLPVVQMLKVWHGDVEPDVPEPDFPPEPSITYDTIRRWCWDNAYPGPIPYNPAAAFQKWGNYGAPVTVEHTAGGWTWQGFSVCILACRTGAWANIEEVEWTE